MISDHTTGAARIPCQLADPDPSLLHRTRRSVRLRALGLRISDLVEQIKTQRATSGHPDSQTARDFVLCDAAFGRLFDDPGARLPDAERHQLAEAMTTFVFNLRDEVDRSLKAAA